MNSSIHSALAREDFNERLRRAEAHCALAAQTRREPTWRGLIVAARAALPTYRAGRTSPVSGSK